MVKSNNILGAVIVSFESFFKVDTTFVADTALDFDITLTGPPAAVKYFPTAV